MISHDNASGFETNFSTLTDRRMDKHEEAVAAATGTGKNFGNPYVIVTALSLLLEFVTFNVG
jgi:hypothetical protein